MTEDHTLKIFHSFSRPPSATSYIISDTRADLHKAASKYDSHLVEAEPDIRSLLATTHVCHRLRLIALAFAPLWSTIPHSCPGDLDLLLVARSGNRPLRVFGDRSGFFRWSTTPIFSTPRRAQIQELYLTQMPMEVCNEKLLAALASHLTYLNVIVTPRYPKGTREPFPRLYFGGEDPVVLRALALSLKAGVSPCDNFPSLAHLRLCGTDTEYMGRMFLQLLADTPVLETLYLVDAPLELDDDWASSDRIPMVQLNRLRALSFDNTGFEAAFAILGHIKFPPDAVVALHRLQYTRDTNLGTMFVPSLTKFTTLEVMESYPALHTRARGEGGGFWIHMTTNRFDVPMLTFRTIIPSLLNGFADTLDMVQTLRVGGSMSETSMTPSLLEITLPTASQLMPTLSSLFVASDSASNPAAHLVPSLKRALLSAKGSVPYPALETLGVLGTLPTTEDKHLLELLADRARRGHRIRTVFVRSSREEESTEALGSSGLRDHVEKIDTRRVTWNPEGDSFWRIENEYWRLYPEGTRRQMVEMWGLPEVERG
ncbi:hypothetical protein K466DRAFT_248783 [Polyporus arcularius HHB13444]|uniref:F-box domain-containing protein n=1 Tax=Polyporus arcularius HHB13444 TaxID=1314778 RepID=A0A5C3PWL3_9APHY|nr:hypothetical protein K466DRAFT_248783 [Polyporus arcularius HHB13444]